MVLSYLFTPGNDKKKLNNAFNGEADAIIVDLEDGVAMEKKDEARSFVAEALSQYEEQKHRSLKPVYIRCNGVGSPQFSRDMAMARKSRIAGIVLPKCEKAEDVRAVQEVLPDVEIIPLIESALGVKNAEEIISVSPKVKKIAFGAVDFALDIGTKWTCAGKERMCAMSMLVLMSRAMGIEPPIGAVFPMFDDKNIFQNDVEEGIIMGFYGKMVIHPLQVTWMREVCQIPENDLDWYRRVVRAYESTEASGSLALDGKLIDLPVYRHAKRMLSYNSRPHD